MEIRVYTGIDIVELHRFRRVLERFGARLLNRLFTRQEQEAAQGRIPSLAARFAAKEAAAKALGCGIGPVGWKDIEVRRAPGGAPLLFLHGRAQARAQALGWAHWSLSLSHSETTAVAVVVALAWNDPNRHDA